MSVPAGVEWAIGGGICLLTALGIVWYMIGWRNRMFGEQAAAPAEEPDRQVLDPEFARVFGSPDTGWGAAERLRYDPADYEGALVCLHCRREILPRQWFWDTPLNSRKTGLPLGMSFQICCSCQPGDVEANLDGK